MIVGDCIFPLHECHNDKFLCHLNTRTTVTNLFYLMYLRFATFSASSRSKCINLRTNASNSLGNKTIKPIRYQLNAPEYFCLAAIWKAHRIIRCFNSLLKGLLGFLRLWVFKITATWYSWKNGAREKSTDNRIVQIIKVRLYLFLSLLPS